MSKFKFSNGATVKGSWSGPASQNQESDIAGSVSKFRAKIDPAQVTTHYDEQYENWGGSTNEAMPAAVSEVSKDEGDLLGPLQTQIYEALKSGVRPKELLDAVEAAMDQVREEIEKRISAGEDQE